MRSTARVALVMAGTRGLGLECASVLAAAGRIEVLVVNSGGAPAGALQDPDYGTWLDAARAERIGRSEGEERAASEDAGNVTGQGVVVDGGLTTSLP